MSDPFLGEIKINAFNFAPRGWAFCNGQSLPINQNNALYSLLSLTFGGDGKANFNLPDLRGRTPMMPDSRVSIAQGNMGGAEAVTLTNGQMPLHTHTLSAMNVLATAASPSGEMLSQTPSGATLDMYMTPVANPPTPMVPMDSRSVQATGGGVGHPNVQPYQVLNFCIAMTGIYPPRS